MVIGTIEARMGSTRMPGKILMEIYDGMSLLEVAVKRFKLCKYINDVYVATTSKPADDPVAEWCKTNNIKYYRGSEDDVLDRVTNTAVKANADTIVQMGADSAYLDFELIDQLINIYNNGGYDYVCNDLEWTYPIGIYGHVIRVSSIIGLNNRRDLSAQDREDVARYIWEHPDEYKIKNVTAPVEFNFPQLRFTIDYPEDLQLAREIYKRFGRYDFTTRDLIELYKKEPVIFEKTKNLIQRSAPFLK
jgi:spore coat polysaccharide biosynthesis protein SpsF (cytidylyltransferase family)